MKLVRDIDMKDLAGKIAIEPHSGKMIKILSVIDRIPAGHKVVYVVLNDDGTETDYIFDTGYNNMRCWSMK